jgi:hypothetical protein
MEPTIDGAPSVQTPTQFSQDRPFVFRYEDMALNISCTLLFQAAFCNRKVSLNFTIIHKSYKCYSITVTDEICWLNNLDR